MGNFKNVDTEFIDRTLAVISQYESSMHQYGFEKQYNHTLLINCLLGLIVFPKERNIAFMPKANITKELKTQMGISESTFNTDITTLKDLIISLRHSLAHFDISFQSNNSDFLIDDIIFKDHKKAENYIVATFKPAELLSFIRYYGWWLIKNLKENQHRIENNL
ncbi:HEPN family nuclease [Flavobacterium bizetiae]|uniref:HEPN family nuclease n=1 Tax=Flavobacterium bizetiae TaxID=2704140 RepID=UPI0021E77593|nr:HEPN family nuclease [Flavobacterium bizetiae]UTN02813.1 HEPN family nuclease [Flavobacterium bizetiae]